MENAKKREGKRRVWRKLYLAVDSNTHEIVAVALSFLSLADNDLLPTLLNPL
tara:strand:+ start:979 stop:1134 length:156 start_codon:yes stop_codon:yes gene_type:complete